MAFLFRRRADPEPTEVPVVHEGRTFTVELRRRPGARRMTLRVSGITGAAALTVSPHIPFDAARRFAEAHGGWIAARVAKVPARMAFGPESVVPLRGRAHRIHHAIGRGVTRATADPDAPVITVYGDAAGVPGRVRRFLVAEAGRDLKVAVGRYTAALGRPARKLTIRDTRSRWGSCSSAGALSFSWRLILAPPFVLDYLAAHEVAHLQELNHSERFWRILRELCPATDEAERWLKRHGGELHRFE